MQYLVKPNSILTEVMVAGKLQLCSLADYFCIIRDIVVHCCLLIRTLHSCFTLHVEEHTTTVTFDW